MRFQDLIKIKKSHIYVADLEPHRGAEPGKQRPVVVVQTDLLNPHHSTVIVCPVTTNIKQGVETLRVHIGDANKTLKHPSDVMVDQLRAIDTSRLKKELGKLTSHQTKKIETALIRLLDLAL